MHSKDLLIGSKMGNLKFANVIECISVRKFEQAYFIYPRYTIGLIFKKHF